MSKPQGYGKEQLLQQFFSNKNNSARLKILGFKKRVQKYLNQSEADTQLLDVIKLLDMFVDKLDYNEFRSSFRIVYPVVERLNKTLKWDFTDIRLAAISAGYAFSYSETHEFANRILSNLEEHASSEGYHEIKLTAYLNVLYRLVRAKFFELDKPSGKSDELTKLFNQYVSNALELCEGNETLWESKALVVTRKAIFERNLEEIDDQLILIEKKGSLALNKAIRAEVNSFSSFSGSSITKLQHAIRVGANIRKLRKSHFLTAGDLAKELGVSITPLQFIEQGKGGASTYMLLKLSDKFNVSIDEIIRGEIKPIRHEETRPDVKKLISLISSLPKSAVIAVQSMIEEIMPKQ